MRKIVRGVTFTRSDFEKLEAVIKQASADMLIFVDGVECLSLFDANTASRIQICLEVIIRSDNNDFEFEINNHHVSITCSNSNTTSVGLFYRSLGLIRNRQTNPSILFELWSSFFEFPIVYTMALTALFLWHFHFEFRSWQDGLAVFFIFFSGPAIGISLSWMLSANQFSVLRRRPPSRTMHPILTNIIVAIFTAITAAAVQHGIKAFGLD